MEEIWRDIKGYEGKYQVSNLGKIKSLFYCNSYTPKLLKTKINKFGFEEVCLSKNNKRKFLLVHKLVAKAFIKNPLSKEQVIHLDGNYLNNNVNNLKWAYISESKHNMYNKGKRKQKGSKTKISYNGKNYNTYAAIARDFGIPLKTFYKRLYELNWSLYEALEIPIGIKERR